MSSALTISPYLLRSSLVSLLLYQPLLDSFLFLRNQSFFLSLFLLVVLLYKLTVTGQCEWLSVFFFFKLQKREVVQFEFRRTDLTFDGFTCLRTEWTKLSGVSLLVRTKQVLWNRTCILWFIVQYQWTEKVKITWKIYLSGPVYFTDPAMFLLIRKLFLFVSIRLLVGWNGIFRFLDCVFTT